MVISCSYTLGAKKNSVFTIIFMIECISLKYNGFMVAHGYLIILAM